MATVSFMDKLKGMKMTEFKFTAFRLDMTSDENGERVPLLILTLDNPIEEIVSSTSLIDPASGNYAHYRANDVTEVKVRMPLVEKYEKEFNFEDPNPGDENVKLSGGGTYKGDMFLDVSRKGEAHLTDVKFSTMSKDWRDKKRTERVGMLLTPKSGLMMNQQIK